MVRYGVIVDSWTKIQLSKNNKLLSGTQIRTNFRSPWHSMLFVFLPIVSKPSNINESIWKNDVTVLHNRYSVGTQQINWAHMSRNKKCRLNYRTGWWRAVENCFRQTSRQHINRQAERKLDICQRFRSAVFPVVVWLGIWSQTALK